MSAPEPRLVPLTPDALDEAQRRLYDAVLASPRGQGGARQVAGAELVQLVLEQQHVRAVAEPREVEGDAGADGTAADDDDARIAYVSHPSRISCWRHRPRNGRAPVGRDVRGWRFATRRPRTVR